MKIDKKNWEKVKLGDVSKEISERVDNPSEYDRFVGLEHLLSGDIKVKNFTSTDKLVSSMKKFQSGDILFARRNTYLKRASLVNFDGICSGDAFVIRVDKERVLGNLLAFLMNSDCLWDYANKHAAGSLNGKRVKWRDLANYEFLLPPKEEQARFAELLWAADEVVERERVVINNLNHCYDLLLVSIMNNPFQKRKIGDITTINSKTLSSKTDKDYQFYYIDIASIISPKILGDLKKYSFSEAPSRARRIVESNSIIASLVRPYLRSFVKIKTKNNELIASTGTAVINAKDNVSIDYIFHSLFSKNFLIHCENRMNGTNYPAITPNDLGDFEIPLPDFETQLSIAGKFNTIDESIMLSENRILKSQQLKSSLINQIF